MTIPADDPSLQRLSFALQSLLQRHGGFVIAEDPAGRFVQWAGGVGEDLLLDVPNLSAEEGIKAAQVFAGQPFGVTGANFSMSFGQDHAAAALAGLRMLREVFGLPATGLKLTEE